MNFAFRDLIIGTLFAGVFVYLLMAVNYQTRGDPFVVILALPVTFLRDCNDTKYYRNDIERVLPEEGNWPLVSPRRIRSCSRPLCTSSNSPVPAAPGIRRR